jgi:hypothetical protein
MRSYIYTIDFILLKTTQGKLIPQTSIQNTTNFLDIYNKLTTKHYTKHVHIFCSNNYKNIFKVTTMPYYLAYSLAFCINHNHL